MKTLNYLPTLLALTIQVMVNGQTQENQARKIRVDIMTTKQPVTKEFINSTLTMSEVEYNELLKQAKDLKVNAQQLKNEAVNIERQSIIKQIQASELSAAISNQKFDQNREIIIELLNKIQKNNYAYCKVNSFNAEAERLIKLAGEMREEANAQLTIEAKFGDMSNAEEKEILALGKQQEIFDLFEKEDPKLLKDVFAVVGIRKPTVINTIEVLTPIKNTNPQITATPIYADETKLIDIVKQASDMKQTAEQLRAVAANATPNEKVALLNEAISLENDYLFKQVEASNFTAKLAYEKFIKNREVIIEFISKTKANTELVNKVQQINSEAEQLMKLGKEIREEANAQLSNAAKLGEISNAEEKETIAITKQKESLNLLEHTHSNISYVIK